MHVENGKLVGPPSPSFLTENQQQMAMNLWCMTGAPLFLGGRLPLLQNESFLLSLLTNVEVLGIHNGAVHRFPVTPTSGGIALNQYAWAAATANNTYVLLINADQWEQEIDVNVADLGLSLNTTYCAFDVWNHYYITGRFSDSFWHWIAGQASSLFRIEPCQTVPVALVIDTDNHWRNVSNDLFSAFIEDINHAIEGGLHAQMVQDYQCEQQVAYSSVSLESYASRGYFLQHCEFVGYLSDAAYNNPFDASFAVQEPGLTGVLGTISFQSVANSMPGFFLTVGADMSVHLEVGNFSSTQFNQSATFALNHTFIANPYAFHILPTVDFARGTVLTKLATCNVPSTCQSFNASSCFSVAALPPSAGSNTSVWLLGPAVSVGQPWEVTLSSTAVHVRAQSDASEPLNTNSTSSIRLDVQLGSSMQDQGATGGICNRGFWGMNVASGGIYNLSMYLRSNNSGPGVNLVASIESVDGSIVYGSSMLNITVNSWQLLSTTLTAGSTDSNGTAKLCLRLPALPSATSIWLKGLSLLPSTSQQIHWVRPDLSAMVANMSPATVRFPGGTYILGNTLSSAYNFSQTIGPWITRPGHADFWGYQSEDLMGFHEYLQFLEDIGSEGVWVVPAGISVQGSVNGTALQPYIDNAVNSLSYALADSNSNYWASIRAAMGHPSPFKLRYIAIGNENCESYSSSPTYVENYVTIQQAVKTAFPNITTVANCDLTQGGTITNVTVEMWDYHTYPGLVDNFIQQQYYWDVVQRYPGMPLVYNSEYAVIGEPGGGNLDGAIGEASWMVGLERNSDLVTMAAYAPLFANARDEHWQPDAIYFSTTAAFGTPSYWNQVLFAQNACADSVLLAYNATSAVQQVANGVFGPGVPLYNSVPSMFTSVSLQPSGDVVIKLVNVGGNSLVLNISLIGTEVMNPSMATVSTITAPDVRSGNSFGEPTAIAIVDTKIAWDGLVSLQPTSINVIRIPGAVRSQR
jgi:alpha-N-arabinofuranosidase